MRQEQEHEQGQRQGQGQGHGQGQGQGQGRSRSRSAVRGNQFVLKGWMSSEQYEIECQRAECSQQDNGAITSVLCSNDSSNKHSLLHFNSLELEHTLVHLWKT